jgi:LysM domain
MASLSEHLRQPDNHAGLEFRGDCPICVQERLAGQPPSDRLMSPRVPAALAAGVLVASTSSPALALAAEGGQGGEGDAPPPTPAAVDGAQQPDYDPGGPATTLSDAPAEAPSTAPEPSSAPAPSDSDADSVEAEPQRDVVDPIADPGDEAPGTDSSQVPAERQPVVQTEAAPAPTPVSPQPATPSSSPAPVPAPVVEEPHLTRSKAASEPTLRVGRDLTIPRLRERGAGVNTGRGGGRLVSRTRVVETFSTVVAHAPEAAGSLRAKLRTRWYVVRANDSLWAIAARHLGYDPATENPGLVRRIQAEVDRLWRLNHGRLRSGKPDLIYPGERLRLR